MRLAPLAFLSSLALAGAPLADGNVTVFVDASGDVWLVGDELDNSLRVREHDGQAGVFEIEDDLGTTLVNGTPSITVTAPGTRIRAVLQGGNDRLAFGGGDTLCCERELVFRGGEGDDVLLIEDQKAALGRVEIDLGPGDDRFELGEDAVVGALVLAGGEGDDVLRFGPFAVVHGDLELDLGDGANRVDWLGGSVHGALVLTGGAEVDAITCDNLALTGFVRLASGAGDDEVLLGSVRPSTGLPCVPGALVLVDAGDGDDTLALSGASELPAGLLVRCGNGRDALALEGASVPGRCTLELGPGDDALSVDDSAFGGVLRFDSLPATATGARVLFDGGAGTDRLRTGLGCSYPAGGPELRAFERPKLGAEPPIRFSLRLAGRVVAAGQPVAGAAVNVAELGLATATDGAGRFLLVSPATPPGWLEVAAGATVGARRLCGVTRVRATAEVELDLGDLELLSDCSNVLVFGDGEQDAATLEQNLRALGLTPEEIQRERFLPGDLSPYAVAWHVADAAPLTAAESERLANFVSSGGGLHLAGEGAAVEAAHEALVNRLVVAGGVQVSVPQGSAPWDPLVYDPDAVSGVSQMPNALGIVMDFVTNGRAIGGVVPPNVFVSGASGQAFSAVWSEADLVGGQGRLSLGLATLWFRAQGNLPALENLEAFLLGG